MRCDSPLLALRQALHDAGCPTDPVAQAGATKRFVVLLHGLPSPIVVRERGIAFGFVQRRRFSASTDGIVFPGDCGFPMTWSPRTELLEPDWPRHTELEGATLGRCLLALGELGFVEEIASRRSLLVRHRRTHAPIVEIAECLHTRDHETTESSVRAVVRLVEALSGEN